MIVVFPAPFSPTNAIRSPGSKHRNPRGGLAQRSLPGYWKPTFSNDKPFPNRIGHRSSTGTGRDAGLDGEERKEILQVQRLGVDVTSREEEALNQVTAAAECPRQKCQGTDSEARRRRRGSQYCDVCAVVAERNPRPKVTR